MFNVGVGAYSLSFDDVGSPRYNGNLQTNISIPKGGACIGFKAARQSDGAFACETTTDRNGGSLIWADDEGILSFSALASNGGATGPTSGTQYYFPNDVLNRRVLSIKPFNSGQVQVGPGAPGNHTDYRLAVDGKLVARSVFVTQLNWADFVFEPTYKLLPLPDLEAYLKANRHLPAIPPAAEVERDGIDLGTINAKLLQSLEELTLHVIELNKQNQRLAARMAELEARLTPTPGAAAK